MIEPAPLLPQASVGIDVVDLASPRALRGLPRPRTVDRVLTDDERAHVTASPDPATVFWSYWAAKEAAFKSVTLLRAAPPVFVHAAFRVDLEAGRVDYGEHALRLTLNHTGRRLVAVTVPLGRLGMVEDPAPLVWGAGTIEALHRGADGASLEQLRAGSFSSREVDAVRALPSALVRMAARREAASFLEVPQSRTELICPPGPTGRRPPYLVVDSELVRTVGVSISHDETWLAWAVAGLRDGVGATESG